MNANRSPEALLRRIELLEHQNRRLKAGGIGLFSTVAVLLLMAQAGPESRTVEAERFVIKDQHGDTRGEFGIDSIGMPNILLASGVQGSGAGVGLYAHADGGAGILLSSVRDGRQGPVAALELDSAGFPRLTFRDAHQKVRVILDFSGDSAGLHLFGPSGSGGVSVTTDSQSPGVFISGKHDRGVIQLKVDTDGLPSLWLLDDSLRIRAVLGATEIEVRQTGELRRRTPSSLVLFGEDRNVVWKAP